LSLAPGSCTCANRKPAADVDVAAALLLLLLLLLLLQSHSRGADLFPFEIDFLLFSIN